MKYIENCGENLTEKCAPGCKYDIEKTVFGFIPNTAELAFSGLVKGIHDYSNRKKRLKLRRLTDGFGRF